MNRKIEDLQGDLSDRSQTVGKLTDELNQNQQQAETNEREREERHQNDMENRKEEIKRLVSQGLCP